jgi:hypothetical protein
LCLLGWIFFDLKSVILTSEVVCPMLILTCVAIVLREHGALSWPEVGQCIEAFVDGPERWRELGVPKPYTKLLRPPIAILMSRQDQELDVAMQVAAARGLLHVLRWLHEYYPSRFRPECVVTCDVMDAAAANGQFEAVKWLHSNRSEGCSRAAMISAVSIGRDDIFQWVHEHYPAVECDSWTLRWMLRQSRAEVALWLHQRLGSDQGVTSGMVDAVLSGRFNSIKYIHEKWPELRWEADSMDSAASGGNLDIVAFLDTHRSEGCTHRAMDHAARHGHLSVVRYLHEHRTEGCTVAAMDGAAHHGHLDVIRFLHQNRHEGCTRQAMDAAAEYGHLEVIKFLHVHRSEGCTTRAMDQAAQRGHMEIIKWLQRSRTEGCTSAAFNAAAMRDDLPLLRFLHEHYHRVAGCTSRAVIWAIGHDSSEMLEWIYEHYRNLFDLDGLVELAERRMRPRALQWLTELRQRERSGLGDPDGQHQPQQQRQQQQQQEQPQEAAWKVLCCFM